jgi:ABC-type glycerol-3-phosphate transport system permease component
MGRLTWDRVVIQLILIVGSVIMAYPLVFGALASVSSLSDYNVDSHPH